MKHEPIFVIGYDLMARVYSGIVGLSDIPAGDGSWRDANGYDAGTAAYELRVLLETQMPCLMVDTPND